MKRFFAPNLLLLIVFGFASVNTHAEEKSIGVNEFRQLYDQLLAGKSLVTESKENGVVVRKTRVFGKAMDVGAGEFEIPVNTVILKTKDGQILQKITIDVLDHVNNLGGNAIISEEVRRTSVETAGEEPRTTREIEFNGVFRVAKNDKGGFDVHNFGLTPSILVDGDKMALAGNMISYSCFPEKGIAKCVLTLRDYKLGDYKPLLGYTLIEPAGGDVVEIAVEATN